MAEKPEFWTEARLKKGITWLVVGIVVVVAGMAGYWYYLNRPQTGVPTVIQRQIDTARADITKDPKMIEPRIRLGQLLIQANDFNGAIAELQAALKLQKDNDIAIVLIGVAYEEQGKTAAAVKQYKTAIEASKAQKMNKLDPAVTEAMYRLANIEINEKEFSSAATLMQQVSASNSMDSDAHYYLGLAYNGLKKYDDAINELVQAVRFVPDYYQANYALGQAYEGKGDKDSARKAYEAALKYKSDYQPAKTALDKLK